jgi:hypothetical protein
MSRSGLGQLRRDLISVDPITALILHSCHPGKFHAGLSRDRRSLISLRRRLSASARGYICKVGRDVDVMISHPQLVATGLDLFTFSRYLHNVNNLSFYQTGYNLFTIR